MIKQLLELINGWDMFTTILMVPLLEVQHIPSITTSTFLSANYVGYYNITTETINEGFLVVAVCFR
jgi:hypothetical protein